MHKQYSIIIVLALIMVPILIQADKIKVMTNPSLYDIKINTLDGTPMDLGSFKGKKILFVNVASKCGFTPQYADLQKWYETHKDSVVVIGVPCNQFGNQEPGSPEEIATFCSKNYGVTFPITEKIEVKGKDQHPLYQWLTSKEKNGVKDSEVEWNFQKYLIDEHGNFMEVFKSNVKASDEEITSLI